MLATGWVLTRKTAIPLRVHRNAEPQCFPDTDVASGVHACKTIASAGALQALGQRLCSR